MKARRWNDDGGFTLPEVLITVVLLGVVMAAIAAAFIVTIHADQDVSGRLRQSRDAQLLSVFLPRDLQSASSVDTSAASPTDCAGSGTEKLGLGWEQAVGTGAGVYGVTYRVLDAGDEWQLVRYACLDASVTGKVIVARDLRDASAVAATASGSKVTLTITSSKGLVSRITGTRRLAAAGCAATAISLTPPAVDKTTAGPGPLASSVAVSVFTIGPCSTLELHYQVGDDPTLLSSTGLTQSGSTYSGTIPAGGLWTDGYKVLSVRQAGVEIEGGAAELAVNEYTEPCAGLTLVPAPTSRKVVRGWALEGSVSIVVATTGTCAGVELLYNPKSADAPPVALTEGPAGVWTGQVPAGADVWSVGDKTLRIRETGASATLAPTATLSVQAPTSCTAMSLTPDRTPVVRKSNGQLEDPLTITVELAGPCTGLTPPKLAFKPNNVVEVTPSTSAAGSSWTLTIAKNTYSNWENGFKDVRVLTSTNAQLGATFTSLFEVTL